MGFVGVADSYSYETWELLLSRWNFRNKVHIEEGRSFTYSAEPILHTRLSGYQLS